MDNQYFAKLPTAEIGDALLEKKDEYYRYLEQTGRRKLLQRSYELYYRATLRGGELLRSGEQGEFVNICANHYHNLIQHRLNMTISQRPQFEPKASNTDSESSAQVRLAVGLLEYYDRVHKVERHLQKATELAIPFAEGFIYTGWNPTKGEEYAKDENGKPVMEGDLEFATFHSFDVIRSTERKNEADHNWLMIRQWKNKHDLAAKYPELSERIVNLCKQDRMLDYQNSFGMRYETQKEDEEAIVYTFFHKKSEALPEGRLVMFCDSDIILHDGPLPYRRIPVFRISSGEMEGSVNGNSNAFNLIPMQEALDKLMSAVITNQAAFAVQNIAVPKGNGINVISITGGMNIVEYDSKLGPPIPLQLCATPPEVFQMIAEIKSDMETLIGVNSVARGNPEANLKSGAALALVQSLAIQFAQGLQQSYAQLLEDVGSSIIEILQDYANTPRVALIAGKSNRPYLKSFSSPDLNRINRVVVDMGNPIMRTISGRVNVAEQLLQNGLVQNAQQYIEVLSTGRIEPIYESQHSENMLIKSENEKLGEGGLAQVLQIDNHQLHIAEHKCVLNSPEARENPKIVASVLQHIMQHMQFSLPAPQGMPPGAPQPTGGNGPSNANTLDTTNPATQESNSVKLPSLPKNPLTGEPNAR
jgi:hypothetical protein